MHTHELWICSRKHAQEPSLYSQVWKLYSEHLVNADLVRPISPPVRRVRGTYDVEDYSFPSTHCMLQASSLVAHLTYRDFLTLLSDAGRGTTNVCYLLCICHTWLPRHDTFLSMEWSHDDCDFEHHLQPTLPRGPSYARHHCWCCCWATTGRILLLHITFYWTLPS